MKQRTGKAFGIDQRTDEGTSWRLVRRFKGQLEVRYGHGKTAFMACASIGWGMAELVEAPAIASEVAE
jgi:hypothetical protein